MIVTSRPSGRLVVCCGEATELVVYIRASLVGSCWGGLAISWCGSEVWMFAGAQGCLRLAAICMRGSVEPLAFRGGRLACGGQALSLRGARPFQREERRWGVKQQVRSVSHDTARLNPAASSPGSSMTSPSCRTLVRCTEGCLLDLADSGKPCLPGSYRDGGETLLRWRVAVSSVLRVWKFPQIEEASVS